MEARVKNERMRIIRDSDPKLENYWYTELGDKEPEVLCIAGPYINSAVIKRLLGSEEGLSISA